MVRPTGGPKDKMPPLVLNSTPTQGATNVSPSLIEIHFDEFFVLKNLASELLISPPLDSKPKISQKGKSLFIELEEKLKENSTYTFNFGKGIADFHEGNVLKNFSLVFSTGPVLDSLSVEGNVFSCPNKKLPEEVLVAIYQTDSLKNDSTIYLQKPDYFGTVNEQGHFHIEHIRAGAFELIAFEDVNANYSYDGASEQIAFHQELINVSDSIAIDLWLFKEEDELKLLESKDNGRLHWAYNKEIDSVEILSDTLFDYLSKVENDSLFVWPISLAKDSLYVWTEIEQRRDSILVKVDTLRKLEIKTLPQEKYLKASEELIIQFSAPILYVDTSLINIISDSTEVEFDLNHTDFELLFEFKHKGTQQFNITLDKGAVQGIYENENDSTVLSIYTKSETALASLLVNLNIDKENYFIELLKSETVIDRLTAGEELIFKELLPSKYQLRLTLDSNKDGKWTPGNYFEGIPAEKVFYYAEELTLRANWELEVDFLMTN
jgi:hypothetical protein